MMREILSDVFKESIIDIHGKDHYTIDLNQLVPNTAVTCPFDSSLKVGKNEKGEVCISKKSFFKPFRK